MTTLDYEGTPLLKGTKPTSIPWSQVLIILFISLAEPLSSQVISPFSPELIREIGITHGNETHVGYYVGLLQSAFYLSEAAGVLYLGRLSDRIGRKPVILLGLAGIPVSSLWFGLSKSIWGLVLSRCLCGILNGNVGVIKSTLPELTIAENLPIIWGCLPLPWTIGETVGPIIGGYLSRPAERYPRIFGDFQFFKTYPYFLPCAIPSMFSAVAWVVVFYLLKETVKSPVPIRHLFRTEQQGETPRSTPLRQVLNSRVIISVGNYALVALIEIAYCAIQPLFLATPIDFGGLGLPPPTIGKILAAGGALAGIFQILFFSPIHRRLGDKATFVKGLAGVLPLFLTFPIAHLLVKTYGFNGLLWVVIALQSIMSFGYGLSYGAIYMYITAAAPDRTSLGVTHGLSQMTVSLMRTIGPVGANGLFSLSIEHGYLGGHLVYYVLSVVTGIAVVVANYLLPQKVWN